MAIKNLEKMDIYNPTNYVNNSEPDIDADNLNKTENKLEETVAKANEIIDALKTLISTVQTNSDNTVPSSSLAYAMQQEITKNKEDIATANSNLASKIAVVTYSKAGIPIAAGDDFFANIPVDIDTSVYRWVFPILSDVSGDNSTKINISNCIWQNTQVHIKGNNQAVGAANISLTGVVVAIK